MESMGLFVAGSSATLNPESLKQCHDTPSPASCIAELPNCASQTLKTSDYFSPISLYDYKPPNADSNLNPNSVCGGLTMGKGKGVPIQKRGEFQKRQQLERMREQMVPDSSDGMPMFSVMVRSKSAKVWYPAGNLKGDNQAKSLIESWRDNSLFLKDQYKSTLDKSMAKSVFDQRDRFVDSIIRMYPQLKKSRNDLEFGYKIQLDGLEDKLKAEGRESELEMTILEESMSKSALDNFKSGLGL